MTAAQKDVERGAVFDETRTYRYRLTRRWGLSDPVIWIMLNPSTADEELDDPTIRRCIDFTKRWGYDALIALNLFAYRSTDPRILLTVEDPVGPENDATLQNLTQNSPLVIAAWGAHGRLRGRGTEVRRLLGNRGLSCLSVTSGGEPGHPLYLPASLRPIPLGAIDAPETVL